MRPLIALLAVLLLAGGAAVTWGFVPDGTAVDPTRATSDGIAGTSQITAKRATYDARFLSGTPGPAAP